MSAVFGRVEGNKMKNHIFGIWAGVLRSLALVAIVGALLAGCHTVKGVGRDVESVGRGVENVSTK